ncbi:PAS domain-containing protein [Bradyrhizobium sp. CER78]|uniref:PAS domain-containing protein n=1 Tax=Bradyrhizobium sp. CER78 TaxID=3039162 RepID=UPI0024498985|nr:PAS domain-containing protein [Bradyrhizobium sp. CER78]MDH2384426.1 histidine kinase dimerization/phospho-acceptor domain-containing protein [Bradyrhizobium sp. CER78]
MSDAEFQIQALGDVRLADHATGALPAWLWSADGARILWANPVGAQVFGAANGAELAKRAFGPADPHRRQVARLGYNLAANGAVRLERLRGFGAAPGMLATCGCTRIELSDGSHGILMTSLNASGHCMPLAERLQRLVQGLPRPAAAFNGDGLLIAANEAARSLPGLHDLTEAGLDAARGEALAQGRAAASVAIGRVVLQRIGRGADRALIALIKPALRLAAKAAAPIVLEPIAPKTAVPEAPAAPQEATAVAPPPAPAAEQPTVHEEAPAPVSDVAATFTLFDALDPQPEEQVAVGPVVSTTASEPADVAPSPASEETHAETAPIETAVFDTTPDETAAVEEPISEALIDVPAEAELEAPPHLTPPLASAERAHEAPAPVETTPPDTTPDETAAVEEPISEALIDVPAEAELEAPAPEPTPGLEEAAHAPTSETSAPPADPVPSPYAIADAPAPPPAAEPEPASLAPAPPPSWLDEPLPVRRHPLRFMWQMDHEARFSLGSDEFTRLIGLHTAAGFGRLWSDIAQSFGLDPEGRVLQAFASHDTWSGITLNWPVDGGGRLPVELSGLPVFDRNRNFAGYRGFGVCRDLDGLARLAALRRYEFFSGSIAPRSLSAGVAPAPRIDAPPAPAAPPHENPPPHAEPPPDTTASAPPEELTEPIAAETSHQADPDHAVETNEEAHAVRQDPPPNVVPFRPAGDTRPPSLTPVENNAFNELARQLSARLESEAGLTATTNESASIAPVAEAPPANEPPQAEAPSQPETVAQPETPAEAPKPSWLAAAEPAPRADSRRDRALLDLLPVGILIYRLDRLLYANHAFLARMGYDSLHALEAAGGLDALYVEPGVSQASSSSGTGTPVTISANQNGQAEQVSAEARLHTISWDDDSALALIFSRTLDEDAAIAAALSEPEPEAAAEPVLAPPPPQAGHADAEELGAILDTAAEGIIMFDAEGNIHSCNRSAEALFGYDGDEFITRNLADLFAPESQHGIFDYLTSVKSAGVASLLDHGRETLGRVRQGGLIPLSVTMGRTRADGPNFFAVFRDLSQTRKSEREVREARRLAERAANAKTDMLARISHELRTPLNAIIGFAEVMISERFGTLGNERYVEYMKDIRASGERVIAIVNDLLDLSRIETGKLDLAFTSQNLNEMVESCVAVMQPQANRERIIIRTSLAHTLPLVVADARALRQITLNLIGNSIHLANAGGQVIVSTALSDFGEVMLRVRDTGQSLNDNEVAAALEPFRAPTPTDQAGSGGVSLSLTKALVEANRAKFQIRTGGRTGTLIEVTFAHAAARA